MQGVGLVESGESIVQKTGGQAAAFPPFARHQPGAAGAGMRSEHQHDRHDRTRPEKPDHLHAAAHLRRAGASRWRRCSSTAATPPTRPRIRCGTSTPFCASCPRAMSSAWRALWTSWRASGNDRPPRRPPASFLYDTRPPWTKPVHGGFFCAAARVPRPLALTAPRVCAIIFPTKTN